MNNNLKDVLSWIGNTVPFLGIDLVDPNQRGNFDETPLSVAIINEDAKAVSILLDAGAEVNVRLEYAETPLHEAARIGDAEIVRLLLSRGARIDALNDSGRTPLDVALSLDRQNIVDLLSLGAAPKLSR